MSKPQRRKGNAKNASSSLAHTYLSEGGSGLFIGLTPEINVFEMAQNTNPESVFNHIDDEARIILRKLVKKDACTREKGLRELIQFMEANPESIEICYEHFVGIVEHLATDGSATVRLLTMKAVSFFIRTLKKSAGKSLKTIIPMVIFNFCDSSNSVCMAAENVFKENFEGAKRAQLFEMFGRTTVQMAVGLINGEMTELCQAARYDEEESVEQRKHRLEVQGFGVIQKLSEEENVEWTDVAEKLFSNPSYLKSVLKGERYNLKTALISVCLKLPNNVEVMINGPIAQWVLDSLDSPNDTICDSSWNAFIVLVGSEKYFEKVSLAKTVLPRILSVIRRKKSHWNKVGPHILPFVATVFENLKQLNSLQSIIESYFDNLPFESTVLPNSITQWLGSFVEIVQWILSKENVDENVVAIVVTAIVRMCKESLKTSDSERRIANLLNWIFEKRVLGNSENLRLCQLVEALVLEDKESCATFSEFLLTNGKYLELAPIHSTLLISCPRIQLLEILERSSDPYFDHVLKRLPSSLRLGEPTSSWSKQEANIVSRLIVRIVKLNRKCDFEVQNNNVWRNVLLITLKGTDQDVWNLIFGQCDKPFFEEMIESWTSEGNGYSVAEAIDFLKTKNIEIDQNEHMKNNECLDYLFELLKSCKSLKGNVELVFKIFNIVFRGVENPSSESMKLLADHLPDNFQIPGFFEDLFENDLDCTRISGLFDQLVENLDSVFIEKFLLTPKDVERLLQSVNFLEVERLCASSSAISIPYEISGNSHDVADEAQLRSLILTSSRLALFNISSKYSTNAAKVYAAIVLNVSKILENRFQFTESSQNYIEEISNILDTTVIDFQPFLKLQSTILADVYLSRKGGKLEHLIGEQEILEMAYSYGLEPEEFLEKIRGDMEESVFCGSWNRMEERLGALLVAKGFLKIAGNVLKLKSRSLVDYLLCGLVTVLDTINDELMKSTELSPMLECLASQYLQVFAKINEFANETNEITPIVDEWKEFYLPTVTRIVINWFGLIKSNTQPTPFVRALLCALNEIRTYPADLDEIETIKEFLPELDAFDYSQTEQSVISHSFTLLDSSIEYVQLIGLKMAKLAMPIMFKKENKTNLAAEKHEEEVELSKERKLQIPAIICRKLNELLESGKWSVVMLFDVCLLPFESEVSNELRVLYCEALSIYVKPCLSTLIIKQPYGIPKSKEELYYLKKDTTPSPLFFNKYACWLLFRTISCIPAAVRLWFKSLPQSATDPVRSAITSNASRLLVEKELKRVKESKYANGGDVDLKIRVIPVTGEIVAEYLVEETKMKLTIGLPPDFPLSVPTLHLDKAIVQTDRARKWLVQLNAYLFHQNGAIVEGIELWRNNVDKGVQGAEACCICMMTIHSNTHQLPKVKCKQCKNKFHSNCLYKWFESSNQSSCPLCRANFT